MAAATPALAALAAARIPHRVQRYRHTRRTDFGAEAAEHLAANAVAADQVLKTLVLTAGAGHAVAVLPVSAHLALKAAASALGVPRVGMAEPAAVSRITGYVLGGVSPLGQRTALPTVIDASVRSWDEVWISGGRRGLEIGLAPDDLIALTGATVEPLRAST